MTAEISKHPDKDIWTIIYFLNGQIIDLEYATSETDAYTQARQRISNWIDE